MTLAPTLRYYPANGLIFFPNEELFRRIMIRQVHIIIYIELILHILIETSNTFHINEGF